MLLNVASRDLDINLRNKYASFSIESCIYSRYQSNQSSDLIVSLVVVSLLFVCILTILMSRAGESPIQIAARFNHAGIVRILLGMKADVSSLRLDWQYGILPVEVAQMLSTRLESGMAPARVRQLRTMKTALVQRRTQLELQMHHKPADPPAAAAASKAGVIAMMSGDVEGLSAESSAKLRAIYEQFIIVPQEKVPHGLLVVFYIRSLQRMFNFLDHKVSFAEARMLYDSCPKDRATGVMSFSDFVAGFGSVLLLMGDGSLPMIGGGSSDSLVFSDSASLSSTFQSTSTTSLLSLLNSGTE